MPPGILGMDASKRLLGVAFGILLIVVGSLMAYGGEITKTFSRDRPVRGG